MPIRDPILLNLLETHCFNYFGRKAFFNIYYLNKNILKLLMNQ